MSPLTFEQRSAIGKKGGERSGKKAAERRVEKWKAWGVDPDVGERIYDAGFQCAYQQKRRKDRREATTS